jgi:Ca2+-binding RTX toxin-like protein
MRSIGAVSVLAIVGTLAVAGSASASTLAVDRDGTLRFTAARGEVNHVDLSDPLAVQTVVTDSGSTITAGNGCVQVTPHEATCPMPANFNQDVAIELADGDDFAHAFKLTTGHIAIDGGPGADTIEDLPQFGAEVTGGTGNDTITVHPNFGGSVDVHGDTGNDTITAIVASGVVRGDAGADQITLSTFVETPTGFSAAYGGAGNDTISASGPTDMSLIDGGFGADTISTATFSHVAVMRGGWGNDAITAVDGTSQILGGLGADVVDAGGDGDGDTINCGLGLDQYVDYPGDTVASCEIALP